MGCEGMGAVKGWGGALGVTYAVTRLRSCLMAARAPSGMDCGADVIDGAGRGRSGFGKAGAE